MKKFNNNIFYRVYFIVFNFFVFLNYSAFATYHSVFHEEGPYTHAFKEEWQEWVNFQTPNSVLTYSVQFQPNIPPEDLRDLVRADLLPPLDVTYLALGSFVKKSDSLLKPQDTLMPSPSLLCGFNPLVFSQEFLFDYCCANSVGRIILILRNVPSDGPQKDRQTLDSFHPFERFSDYLYEQTKEMIRVQNGSELNDMYQKLTS